MWCGGGGGAGVCYGVCYGVGSVDEGREGGGDGDGAIVVETEGEGEGCDHVGSADAADHGDQIGT